MRTLICLLALCAAVLHAQEKLPPLQGETLSGKNVTLPAAAGGRPALLIIGFTHASRTGTKAWDVRVDNHFPTWSIAVLQDVPRLVRGMVVHGIKGGTPKEDYGRFVLIYHGEKQLKQAAGFDRPDDAYLLVIDPGGAIRWRYHGPVTDAAWADLQKQFAP